MRKILVECDCGCGILKFIKEYHEGEKEYYIDFYGSMFYEKQQNIFSILFRRLKFAWYIIRGKDFHFYDILLTGNNAIGFEMAIQELLEE